MRDKMFLQSTAGDIITGDIEQFRKNTHARDTHYNNFFNDSDTSNAYAK
jgi:hypothetical protein